MNHNLILLMGDPTNLLTTPVLVALLVKKEGKEILAMMKHGRERALAQVVEEGEEERELTEPQLQPIQVHQRKVIDKQQNRGEQLSPPELPLPIIRTRQLIPDIQKLHARGLVLVAPEVPSRVLRHHHRHPTPIISLLIDE